MNEGEAVDGPNIQELESAGQKVTRKTLEFLRRRERDTPGFVGTVIVHFRSSFHPSSVRFMREAERNQGNQETRHSIAQADAERTQSHVREWLLSDPHSRDCFTGCRNFQFEPARMVKRLPVTNCMITPATSRLVEALEKNPVVVAIQRNLEVHTIGQNRLDDECALFLGAQGSPTEHQDGYTWGWHRLGLPSIHRAGITGRGMIIGMANSGTCEDHSDLVFKVKDFAKVEPSGRVAPSHSFDLLGHGTHCAGIMVGAKNSGIQIGGAPDAELKVVSIMEEGKCYLSSLLASIEWFVDPYRAVNVLNLSVGLDKVDGEYELLFHDLVGRLEAMGCVCVAAIGNEPHHEMYPARLRNVVGCGVITPEGTVWEKSGHNPDFVLPGTGIFSCVPPNHPQHNGQSHFWYDGSSASAAHMSSLIALFMQRETKASPAEIRRAFCSTATRGENRDSRYGYGEPNLLRALDFCQRKSDLAHV